MLITYHYPLINKCSIIFFEDKEVDGGEDDNDFALNDGDGDNDDYDLYGNNNNMFACINIKNVCMNV